MTLYAGTLYVQTNWANISAFDAETGRQLWSKNIGRPDFPSLPLAVEGTCWPRSTGRSFTSAIATTARCCTRPDRRLAQRRPALSDHFAFVPTDAGTILAYRLEPLAEPGLDLGASKTKDMSAEEKTAAETARRDGLRLRQDRIRPIVCQSNGRSVVPPLVTRQNREEDAVVWPTDRGVVSRGAHRSPRTERHGHHLRVQDRRGDRRPVGLLAAESQGSRRPGRAFRRLHRRLRLRHDGNHGNLSWKFPTSEPVVQPPAVIEDRVYIVTQLGGMFCCNAKTGKQSGGSPEILQFVAASKQRVYAADRTGHTQVLDAKTRRGWTSCPPNCCR